MEPAKPAWNPTWEGFGKFLLQALQGVPKGLWSVVSAPSHKARYTKPEICQCSHCGNWHYQAIVH